MSNLVVNLVRNLPSKILTANERYVLRELSEYVNAPRGIMPSFKTISDKTGLARSTVIEVVKKLKEKNFLNKFSIHENNTHSNNRYTINIKLLEGFSMKNISTKSVDKAVDKPVENVVGSPTLGLGGSLNPGLGGSPTVGPKHIDHNKYKKHQMIEQQEMDLKNVLVEELLRLKVADKDIQKWLGKLGPHHVYAKLREIRDSNERLRRERKKPIENIGAYLRALLEGSRKTA